MSAGAAAAAGWSPWIEGLLVEVRSANARIVSMFAKLAEAQHELTARIDQLLEKVGRAEERREQAMTGERHQRILEAVRRGELAELGIRERRYAVKQFEELTPSQLQGLLHESPEVWQALVAACLRRWEAFLHLPGRAALVQLLARAPTTVRCLHVTGRPLELLSEEGTMVVTRRLRATALSLARHELGELGFDVDWQFTAVALARWTWTRRQVAGAFAALWDELSRDPIAEAMVLPRLVDAHASWFSSQARPARAGASPAAQAIGVAALLGAAYGGGALPRAWGSFVEKVLASELGDPRIPPESEGWIKVKHIDLASYQRFLEGLVREDLSVFFEHAMEDSRREAFWLRYVRAVRRTTCILDRRTHAELRAKLLGADERLSAAMTRARQFTASGSREGAQAFCLYFDRLVVVEFSDTGNAAYVYDRGYFEKRFAADIQQNRCPSHARLKQEEGRLDRIVHAGARWEERAEELLARHGVFAGGR